MYFRFYSFTFNPRLFCNRAVYVFEIHTFLRISTGALSHVVFAVFFFEVRSQLATFIKPFNSFLCKGMAFIFWLAKFDIWHWILHFKV